MNIECPACNQLVEVPDGLVDGQHIECPYCQHKFLYAEKGGADEIKIPPHPVKAVQPPPVPRQDPTRTKRMLSWKIHCIVAFLCGIAISSQAVLVEGGLALIFAAIGIYLISKLLIINLFDKDK